MLAGWAAIQLVLVVALLLPLPSPWWFRPPYFEGINSLASPEKVRSRLPRAKNYGVILLKPATKYIKPTGYRFTQIIIFEVNKTDSHKSKIVNDNKNNFTSRYINLTWSLVMVIHCNFSLLSKYWKAIFVTTSPSSAFLCHQENTYK